MNGFESALEAAFGVDPAEVPGLRVDRLTPASADPSGTCSGRAGGPVPGPVAPSVSICRAARAEPVAAIPG